MHVFNKQILSDLVNYGNDIDDLLFQQKVTRVHRKCIRSGRMELAEKIFQKYSKHFTIKSDAAMAFYMSVIAAKAK